MTQIIRLSAHRAAMDYPFSDAEFARIANRALGEFGLHLPSAKKHLVYSRLVRRLRKLGLPDFQTYCDLLDGPRGAAEQIELLSALTTNVTQFFREEHHFRKLRETVLPPLIAAARAGRRVRLWSAGCSAGQEPYSLAFTVLALCPEAEALDLRILATDIDPAILAVARAGRYPKTELKTLPEPARGTMIHVRGDVDETFTVGCQPRALIRFGELNLIKNWPMRGRFDVIFCRNVAIYFDAETQARLWGRFADMMYGGGHLFIGHSERVTGPAASVLTSAGITTYRKAEIASATGQSVCAVNARLPCSGIPSAFRE
jgi:chemotaxis protein methyltransferase CheR